MKTCSKCHCEKTLDDFHKSKNSLDGHKSSCKECRKTEENPVVVRLRASKWYYDNPERAKTTRITYRNKHKESWNKYQSEWRKNHPQHAAAHWTVNNKIRQGSLERQPCEVCGKHKAHAHHDNYSKRLDVRWLCPKHHSSYHREVHTQQ